MVWIIGMQSAGHSGICVGRNRHVQVYWNTLLILPVITLALVSALLLASFFLSPGSVSLNVSHLFCLFLLLLISLPQFSTSSVTPSTTSLSSSFFAHCVSITFLCWFLPPYLHYHSPHPHLSIPLLSPVRLEWKITEIPSRLSWIGYADVTDTTAPHKYTAYYLPVLRHTYEALPSSRLTSRLHKEYGIFAATEFCATPQQIYANQFILFTCARCHPCLSVCLWEETVRNCCSFSQPQLKQTRAVCSHSSSSS